MFSESWMDTVGSGVEPALRECVLELCRAYQLGNSSDPGIVAEILSRHLSYWRKGLLFVEHGCSELDEPGLFK